jgi:hypothetical protein
VPHQLLREKVWARITARTIEVFHRGKRIAAHVRSSSNRKLAEHDDARIKIAPPVSMRTH